MRLALLSGLTVVMLIMQTSVLPMLIPRGLIPDLPLLLVLTWGLAFGGGQGLLAAALGGVAMDSLSALPFGTHLLALLPAALLGTVRETDLFASRASLPFVLVPLSTVAFYAILALLMTMAGRQVALDQQLPGLATALVLNAAVSPGVFLVSWAVALRYSDQFRTVSRP